MPGIHMDEHQIRRSNFRRLIANSGGNRAVAKRCQRSEGYISGLANGTADRGFSEKNARYIEEKMGLTRGTLDRAPDSGSRATDRKPVTVDWGIVTQITLAVQRFNPGLSPEKVSQIVNQLYDLSIAEGKVDMKIAERISKAAF